MNQFEMKQRAYQSNLKNRALQVLLYLIDRANKEQTCFPAVPTISRELHISISTVKRAMRELVEAGYVTKESRFREGNRGQTSNLYTLYFPEEEKESRQEKTEQGDISRTESEQIKQTGAVAVCLTLTDTEQGCKEQEKNCLWKKYIAKILCLPDKNRGLFASGFRWPGEEVNLIPP